MSKKAKKKKINSYLTFELDNELFAIHVNKILSILEMKRITKIPQTPDYMKGIINLRGQALPVIDSHIKFNLSPIDITMKTSILVIELKQENSKAVKLGLMVDKVNEVLQIEAKSIIPPPNIGNSHKTDYITGIYKKEDKTFVMIIDINSVLSIKEIVTIGDLEKIKIDIEDKQNTELQNENIKTEEQNQE